ncbi:hypothetical protein ACFWFI_33015 [Streptomyces sp. NPDC060209]|uniref:MmyB family transcriptional regulator n=1 Tax=Streptomyces sp. NPDC060209 TaxID=3347073 RepID=UPI00365F0F80
MHVCREGTKRFRHPAVGDLNLDHHEAMGMPDESALSILVYSAPAGSAAEEGLKLLACWAATAGQGQAAGINSPDWASRRPPAGRGRPYARWGSLPVPLTAKTPTSQSLPVAWRSARSQRAPETARRPPASAPSARPMQGGPP